MQLFKNDLINKKKKNSEIPWLKIFKNKNIK